MAYEQRDNSGSLFKNDKKTADNHPDYKGSIMVGGSEYWLSAWLKTSTKGVKYMSLAVKAKENQDADPAPQGAGRGTMDQDIPFDCER